MTSLVSAICWNNEKTAGRLNTAIIDFSSSRSVRGLFDYAAKFELYICTLGPN